MLRQPSQSAASENQTFAANALHPQSLLFYTQRKRRAPASTWHLFLSRALLFYAKSLLSQIETIAEKQQLSEKFDHAVWRFGSTSIFQGAFPPGRIQKHCQSSIFTQWG